MSDIDQEYEHLVRRPTSEEEREQAEAALAAAKLEREANVSAAVTWLRNVMEDDKPVLRGTIRRRARAVGIPDSNLLAARDKLGITGASGGGNQTMYAGALDERFRAAVPVCSVGTYHAYLKSASCVCEVLPGALTFSEEGDAPAVRGDLDPKNRSENDTIPKG